MTSKFRKHFDYDVEAASNEAAIPADGHGKSLTVQSMAEDADVNVMMKRFGITGKMPESPRVPSYGDFSGVNDFRSAMDAVLNAQDMFMEFPAEVRAKFGNDPQKLLEFVSDKSNRAQLEALGLASDGLKAELQAERIAAENAAVDARRAAAKAAAPVVT